VALGAAPVDFSAAFTAGGGLVASRGVVNENHARLDASGGGEHFFLSSTLSVLLLKDLVADASLSDLGSVLRAGVRDLGFLRRLALELLPFNSASRLPFFDWVNRWALQDGPAIPTLTAEIETKAADAFFSIRLDQPSPALFFGVSTPTWHGLRLEARGGHVQRLETNPLRVSFGGLDAWGGAARASWSSSEVGVGPPVDLRDRPPTLRALLPPTTPPALRGLARARGRRR
jgi:hypothetical protein